ncbi:MAG: GAF domain-containing protein [Bacteroidetes bacterium]|nr:GAF domain-containing protein [Bacteroidota bacterium]
MMKLKMKLNQKMILYILTTTILIYFAAFGYVSFSSKKMATDDVEQIADSYAREYANIIKSGIDIDVYITRTFSQVALSYDKTSKNNWHELYLDMQKNILIFNPQFLSVATSWELSAIDSAWDKPYGRRLSGWYRENGEIKFLDKILNADGDIPGSNYLKMKTSGKQKVVDPEFYSYSGKKEDAVINSNVSVPIMNSNRFIGLAGADNDLGRFQKIVEKIKPFKDSYSFLLSNNGVFVAHPNLKYVGEFINKTNPEYFKDFDVIKKIQKGQNFSFIVVDKDTNKKSYISFASVNIKNISTPWSIGIVVPFEVIVQKANESFFVSIIIGMIGLIILTIVIWLIAKNITHPLIDTTKLLKNLALGKIDKSKKLKNISSKDEIGEMAQSLYTLTKGLGRTADFANEIGKGNLDAKFDPLSDEDIIGYSLLNMRDSLKKAKSDDRIRKEEEEKNKWITHGIAIFGDVLRQDNDNLEKLSFNIMKNLVNYIEANQGALFVLNDEDKKEIKYELKSAIAYDRQRILNRTFNIAEGLIGRCAFEKQSIYMIDIPDDYVNITSGLGGANPRSLLVVPAKFNDTVFGVIEIVSFKKLEKYQIEFLEKVSDNIASTISTVKVNEQTAKLLEQFQKQSEELSAQEEEMRQNLEEMQATQEEAAKRGAEMTSILEAIKSISFVAEYDMEGRLLDINDKFLTILGLSREQMIGKQQGYFSIGDEENAENPKLFWDDIRAGINKKKIQHIKFGNKDMWISEEYMPISDIDGTPFKVLNIAFDITDSRHVKKLEEKLKKSEG